MATQKDIDDMTEQMKEFNKDLAEILKWHNEDIAWGRKAYKILGNLYNSREVDLRKIYEILHDASKRISG